MAISRKVKVKLLTTMLKIRRFEETIVKRYPEQKMRTPVHLYIGQEAVAAAVCSHLKKSDFLFSTHRNHGHYIAKGADMRLLMAELYGKVTGCAKGKAGSMHPVSPEFGIPGTSAIVGGAISLAVGVGLALKLKKEGKVSVAFFGDGAVDEGSFFESLNFAALKKLPVVFVCENNFYATNSPLLTRQSLDNIADKAKVFGVPGIRVDGNDVLRMYPLAKKAIERARKGLGPTLIECRTYRFKGHVGPECDHEKGCRPRFELEKWIKKCPLTQYTSKLLKDKLLSQKRYQLLVSQVDKEIEKALVFAQESPYPQRSDAFSNVYYPG